MCAEVKSEDLPVGVVTKDPNGRWYEAITTQSVAAVCYATTVILLGPYPWNFLLILFLFFIKKKRLRFDAFDRMSSGRLGSSQ
jgi:hypothetical protein